MVRIDSTIVAGPNQRAHAGCHVRVALIDEGLDVVDVLLVLSTSSSNSGTGSLNYHHISEMHHPYPLPASEVPAPETRTLVNNHNSTEFHTERIGGQEN